MAFSLLFPSMNPVMTDITLKQKPQSINLTGIFLNSQILNNNTIIF